MKIEAGIHFTKLARATSTSHPKFTIACTNTPNFCQSSILSAKSHEMRMRQKLEKAKTCQVYLYLYSASIPVD